MPWLICWLLMVKQRFIAINLAVLLIELLIRKRDTSPGSGACRCFWTASGGKDHRPVLSALGMPDVFATLARSSKGNLSTLREHRVAHISPASPALTGPRKSSSASTASPLIIVAVMDSSKAQIVHKWTHGILKAPVLCMSRLTRPELIVY